MGGDDPYSLLPKALGDAVTYPADAVIGRARSMLGRPIAYVLGCGGRNPGAATPETTRTFPGGTKRTGSDCIGFVAWCSGFDRFNESFPLYGGWINTDSSLGVWNGTRWNPIDRFFRLVTTPVAGCWVVYPSIDLDHDGKRDRIGHVGIVSDVSGWESRKWDGIKVIHCSAVAYRKTGSAIIETAGTIWGRASSYRGHQSARWGAAFLVPQVP